MSDHLPYDIARCEGNGREECKSCLRKLSPGHPKWQNYLAPWVLDSRCESRIPVSKFKREAELERKA